jgi:hypothetical protein
MFQLFQSYVAARNYVVNCKYFIFGRFMCFTHVAKSMFPSVSSIFSLMLHSCCNYFMLFGQGEPRPADGGAAVGACWGHARPEMLIAAPECGSCGEGGGEVRGDGRGQ